MLHDFIADKPNGCGEECDVACIIFNSLQLKLDIVGTSAKHNSYFVLKKVQLDMELDWSNLRESAYQPIDMLN